MGVMRVLLLLGLMPVVSFAPGFFVVRGIRRWGPVERLAAAVGVSVVFVYLVAFLIYNTLAPWPAGWAYTALSVVLLHVCRHDARRLWAVPQVRRIALLFGGLFLWNLLMLLIIRNYVGGFWGPDWYEHYERAMHFVQRGPDQYLFLGEYLLPARPPIANLFSAFFLGQLGADFAIYQLTFAFLNLLPFVGVALLLPLLAKRASRRVGLLAALLACSPMFMHNAQFTWTKSAPGFFIALGLWFYLVGWRREDAVRMALAFVSLSAATLVHFSGGPYLVVLAVHYMVFVFWARRGFELYGLCLAGAAMLATWFAYSVSAYGVHETFMANSTVLDSSDMSGAENLSKIVSNLVNTLVPHLFRGFWVERNADQFRYVVDNAFYFYQVNLPFAFGAVGCFLVIAVFLRGLAQASVPIRERLFWVVFVVLAIVLSIAVIGPPDNYGVAHIGLQPLVQLGTALLAARFLGLPDIIRALAFVGLVVDFVFGIAMHLWMEASVAEWASDHNMTVKTRAGLVFLGDWLPMMAVPLQLVVWGLFVALLAYLYRAINPATSGSPSPASP